MILALAAMMLLQAGGVKPDCHGNTLEVNACLVEKRDASEKRLQKYLDAALRRPFNDPDSGAVPLGIRASQQAFEAYRDIECATLFETWKGGTVRVAMSLRCETRLTDERTHMIWSHWLRYVDRTPPILPEPKPTQ